MASFMYAVMSITQVASMHCAERPEISPCTCESVFAHNYVELSCEKVDSFHTIVNALSQKFDPNVNMSLKISYSQLEDLEMRSFKDMNLKVVKLRMQSNGLKSMPELPFRGLSNVEYLSVGDNELDEVPKHMLNHMPSVKTLDLGRCRIRSILQDDFKGVQMVHSLFLVSNNITRLDKGTFPNSLVTLHLARNQIENLNGTLRDLNKLESLFINMNLIASLDNELPDSNKLRLILAQSNRLEHLPERMRYMNRLETLHIQHNRLVTLDGILKHKKYLNELMVHNNQINYLASDEFQGCQSLQELEMGFNNIKSLNRSLLHLKNLCRANFTMNEIEEFSINEVRGLMHLKELDLSYNRIQKLTGRQDNNVDQDSELLQILLDHNHLESLDGALMGLNSLQILSLSYNRLQRILPEDFIGLVKLAILDLSHNQLLQLSEMATTYLPSLQILKVAYNNLTTLDKDFHGLPILCQANLTNNQIKSISTDLVSQTRCKNHNVPGKLELYLDDNPIMCDERLNELCAIMSAQETRIRGRSVCFESDQEVCTSLPRLFNNDVPTVLVAHKLPNSVKSQVPIIVAPPMLMNEPLIAKISQVPIPTYQKVTIATQTEYEPPEFLAANQSITNTPNETTPTTTTTTTTTTSTTTTTTTTTEPTTTARMEPVIPLTKHKLLDDEEPIVLNIEEIPLLTSVHSVSHENTSISNVGQSGVENTVRRAENSLAVAAAVTVPQTEYATVEYIPNLEEYLPLTSSNRATLPRHIQQSEVEADGMPSELMEHGTKTEEEEEEAEEVEDSKSNSVHEEYPAVVLASHLDDGPENRLILKEPPETP